MGWEAGGEDGNGDKNLFLKTSYPLIFLLSMSIAFMYLYENVGSDIPKLIWWSTYADKFWEFGEIKPLSRRQRWTIGSNLKPAPIWSPELWGSSSSSKQKKWSLKALAPALQKILELKSSNSSSGKNEPKSSSFNSDFQRLVHLLRIKCKMRILKTLF